MELFTISQDIFLTGGWKFQKILYLREDFYYINITVFYNSLRQKNAGAKMRQPLY